MENLYRTSEWRHLAARAKARDGGRCTIARIFGGSCAQTLHAHHVVPVEEGGPMLPDLDGVLTVCSAHHRTLHAVRRYLDGRSRPKVRPCRCRGGHRYREGRRLCRAKRLREAGIEPDTIAA